MTHARQNKLFLALCGNAVLLGLIAVSAWPRAGAAPALGQTTPPPVSATADGVTIVPAQLSSSTFGCYLLDANQQTLCVYQYRPGEHELRLEAARDVQYDRRLKLYNTTPPPAEVQRLADRAAQPPRTLPPSGKDSATNEHE